jgi:hypothetical protein
VNGFLLNGDTFDVLAQSAQFTLSEGQHDQAVITVSSPTLTTTEGLTDQPISFRWGVTPRIEQFNGYIMDVKESTAEGSTVSLSFTMSVLGATKAMFDGTPNFWTNKAIPSAVRDLAAKNQLGYAGHDHTYLWQALAQTSESDWAFVTNLVKRIGWQITNRYGVVMCHDPVKLFTESGMFTRLVMGGATGLNLQADRILLDFQPIEEADIINTNLGVQYGYFTSSGSPQIGKQPGDFRGYVFGADTVVADQEAAQQYTNAGNTDMDRWKQYALARIWGDADIYPGMCVEVVTTNKAYLRTKYDGKWLVRSTSHQMDRQQYQTMLSLARPSAAKPVINPSYTPFWQDPSNQGRAKPYLSLVLTSTSDQVPQWVSTWSDRRVGSLL